MKKGVVEREKRIRGYVRVENAHTWAIRGMTKRRNKAAGCLKNSETFASYGFYFTIRS